MVPSTPWDDASRLQTQRGFSLVELTVVVGIIGILASLAIPKFQEFVARAKQAEAKIVLKPFSALDESYFGAHDAYTLNGLIIADLHATATICNTSNAIGLYAANCTKTRYFVYGFGYGNKYYGIAVEGATAQGTGIIFGRTVGNCNPWGGFGPADIWSIDETKLLINSYDAGNIPLDPMAVVPAASLLAIPRRWRSPKRHFRILT